MVAELATTHVVGSAAVTTMDRADGHGNAEARAESTGSKRRHASPGGAPPGHVAGVVAQHVGGSPNQAHTGLPAQVEELATRVINLEKHMTKALDFHDASGRRQLELEGNLNLINQSISTVNQMEQSSAIQESEILQLKADIAVIKIQYQTDDANPKMEAKNQRVSKIMEDGNNLVKETKRCRRGFRQS